MKYYLVSILLLLALMLACVTSACYVTASVRETETLLQKAQLAQTIGDHASVQTYVSLASDTWTRHQDYFSVVLQHHEVDDVVTEFAQLNAYAKSDDQDDFNSNCAGLLAKLEHLRKMEWPYLYNIL